MFSQWLGEHDELLKFISAPNCEQQQTILLQENKVLLGNIVNPSDVVSDINVDYGSVTNNNITKPKSSRRRKLSSLDNVEEESPKDYIKKIIHRDVERQRRQEMASLYHKLRSLIPSQHLEGKRSISNHIHGSVEYIMHMKNKIDELKNKREKLRKSLQYNPSSSSGITVAKVACSSTTINSDVREQPIITVLKSCNKDGINEITVNIGRNGDLSLSKIFRILISEGMSIKSCISTRLHERQLHVIQSEVNEEKIIDTDELYKKLMMGTAAGN